MSISGLLRRPRQSDIDKLNRKIYELRTIIVKLIYETDHQKATIKYLEERIYQLECK